MELEIVGSATAIVLSVLGSHWRTMGAIRALVERIDRAAPEETRDRVTRLEVRVDQVERRCDG
ncbi:MAG: hypothetical protein PVJ64_00325 [Gemmatimonadales bacterium]